MGRAFAMIPARGGSKGLPNKNLQPLLGVPLVAWAIRAARKAQSVDCVAVSTDKDTIADVARAEGALVVARPAELATDAAPTLPTIVHALAVLEAADDDLVVLCEPTSPFRSPAVIDLCISKLASGDCQSVVTVTQVERNPFNIFRVTGDRAERFIESPNAIFSQRQQMRHLKRVNGCIYATRAGTVRLGRLMDPPIRVVEMSGAESINIDEEIDLRLAELLAPHFSDVVA